MGRSNFSPRTWIRYWVVAMVFGASMLVWSVFGGGVQIGYLGAMMFVIGFPMIGFWKRKQQDDMESHPE